MICIHFQGKPYNTTVIQVHAPTTNVKEAEGEDIQDFLGQTKKDVLFIRGDWNTKVGSQEIPGVIGKFGLEVQNEAGQNEAGNRLTEFYQENTLIVANTFF